MLVSLLQHLHLHGMMSEAKPCIKLDQVKVINRRTMIEQMHRGGLCFVDSNSYVKAHNTDLPDYAANVEANKLKYEVAHNS